MGGTTKRVIFSDFYSWGLYFCVSAGPAFSEFDFPSLFFRACLQSLVVPGLVCRACFYELFLFFTYFQNCFPALDSPGFAFRVGICPSVIFPCLISSSLARLGVNASGVAPGGSPCISGFFPRTLCARCSPDVVLHVPLLVVLSSSNFSRGVSVGFSKLSSWVVFPDLFPVFPRSSRGYCFMYRRSSC